VSTGYVATMSWTDCPYASHINMDVRAIYIYAGAHVGVSIHVPGPRCPLGREQAGYNVM